MAGPSIRVMDYLDLLWALDPIAKVRAVELLWYGLSISSVAILMSYQPLQAWLEDPR